MRKPFPWLLTLFLVACGAPDTDPRPAAEPAEGEWVARIEGGQGFQQLSAAITAVPAAGSTTLRIELEGAAPGVLHPWHVHEGRCGSGGSVVGEAARYPAIRTGIGGTARGRADIAEELQPGRDYHVNLLVPRQDGEIVVACGELRGTD